MNLLIAIFAITAIGGLVRFLVALHKEEKTTGPQHIYIAQERRPGLHKVSARCYGPLTVIDGGNTARPFVASQTGEQPVPLKTIPWVARPDVRWHALRQG